MHALALAAIITLPTRINLDSISVERARTLEGRLVMTSFVVGKPAYTWRGLTTIGTDDLPDGVERSAVLKGWSLASTEGHRVTVVGVMRGIQHPARQIGNEFVLPWSEIRIEERN
jgi:hypothetical protein